MAAGQHFLPPSPAPAHARTRSCLVRPFMLRASSSQTNRMSPLQPRPLAPPPHLPVVAVQAARRSLRGRWCWHAVCLLALVLLFLFFTPVLFLLCSSESSSTQGRRRQAGRGASCNNVSTSSAAKYRSCCVASCPACPLDRLTPDLYLHLRSPLSPVRTPASVFGRVRSKNSRSRAASTGVARDCAEKARGGDVSRSQTQL